MNKVKLLKRILLVLLLCMSTSFAEAPKTVMTIQHWTTKQGMQVYFVHAPELPIVDIRAVFAAGSAYDGKNYGAAALTNAMIGKRTMAQNGDQVAKTFDKVGAQFNVATGRDMAIVSLRSLSSPRFLKIALSEFTHVLTKTAFPLKTLQRVKNRTIAAIKAEAQNPVATANNAFYSAVYGDQPYAHEPLGTMTTVPALTRMQLQGFYRHYYVAKNADLIIVGNLTMVRAKLIAYNISRQLPIGQAAKRLQPAKSLTKAVVRHIPFPAKQTAVVIGQVSITRDNPAFFPLIVGNHVLGGLPLASILFKQVRDQRGLAYHVASAFQPLLYRGPFKIELQTRTNKAKEALEVVEKTLKAYIAEGPTEEQLNAAKQHMVGSFPLGLASNKNITGVVTRIAFYHRPLTYLNTYRDQVRAVTREQVKAAFEQFIKPSQMVTITVGPQANAKAKE